MPTYSAVASDGVRYDIEGPPGATQKEILAAIEDGISFESDIERKRAEYLAYLRDRKEIQPEPEDTDNFLEDIYKGLAAGAIQTLEMAALGAVAPLGEEAETSARDVIKSVADTVRPELANPEGALSKLSQGIGSILGFAPALLAGPVAAPFITAGLAVGAGAGEASERARAADASVEERGRAALLGTLPGALDIIPLARLSRKFGPDVVGELVDKFGKSEIDGIGSRIRRAAATGGIEGAQEVAQGVAQNLIERGYNEDAEILKGTGEEGLIGAGAGAIIQGLLDAFAGRRGPSTTTPTEPAKPVEPTQGELFSPDADLGITPPSEREIVASVLEQTNREQGELFPRYAGELESRAVDLGRAPVEDTQLDLFGPAGSPEVGRRLAELERRREPTQEELPFESVPGAEAEQAAQAAARERAALRAVERGDEAAFEQPDLFALQQEQEDRRLGTPRWPADQFMDVQEEAEVAPVPEAEQLDIEDAIAARQQGDTETAQLEEMVAADETLRAESDLETIGGQLDTQQQQETAAKRGAILDSVLTDLRDPNPEIARGRFISALRDEGITKTAPTGPELRAINRATDVVAATRAEDAALAKPIKPRQQYQMRLNEKGERLRAPQTDLRELEEVRGPDARQPAPREIARGAVSVAPRTDDGTSGARVQDIVEGTSAPVPGDTEGTPALDPAPVVGVEPDTGTPDVREGREQAQLEPPITEDLGVAPESAFINEDVDAELSTIGEQLEIDFDTAITPITPVEPRAASAKTRKKPQRRAASAKTEERPTGKSLRQKRVAQEAAARKVQGVTITEFPPSVQKAENAVAEARDATGEQEIEGQIFHTPEQLRAWGLPPGPLATRLSEPFTPVTEESQAQETAQKRRTKGQNREIKEFTKAWDETASNNLKVFVSATDVRSYIHERLQRALRNNPDPLTEEDIRKVRELLGQTKTKGGKPRLFFSRQPDPVNGLVEIAYALTGGRTANLKGMTDIQKEYFGGMNAVSGESALAWVKNNLSEGAHSWALSYRADLGQRPNVEKAKRGGTKKYLAADAVAAVDVDAHPMVGVSLIQGDIKNALRIIAATTGNKRLANVARRLGDKLGDTKVEVVENLTDELGVPMAGHFDPKTNTIRLDAKTGINTHTVLHETTHALTSATLANKSHTVTKKLEKLFNDIQDSLGDVYGARNVDEFVSEAFGNVEFQQFLAGINPKGGPISALQRFANIVTNFVRSILGMNTKPLKSDSVLDRTDQLVNSILAPAPQHRDAGILYMNSDPASVAGIMKNLGNFSKGFPKLTKGYRKDFVDAVKQSIISDKAKETLGYISPMQALADMAGGFGLRSAQKLHDAIQLMNGSQGMSDTHLDAAADRLTNWLKGKPDATKKAFNNLVYRSTTQQVDPYALEEKYENNADKLAVWKDMRKDVKTIDTGGKEIYTLLRNTYARQAKQLQEVLTDAIDNVKDADGNNISEDAKKELKKTVFDKIFEKNRIEPYFPLTREGDYWLSFTGKDPNTGKPETVYMAFKSGGERNAFIKNIEGDPDVVKGTINQYSNPREMTKGGGKVSDTFVAETLQLLGNAKVAEDVQQEFLQIFLHTMPESSFAKQLISRGREGQGELGHIEDAELAFRQRAYDMGAQIARMKHTREINDIMSDLKKEYETEQKGKNGPDKRSARIFYEELQLRASFAKSPPRDAANRLAAQANRVAFIGTIGFNVSSALVNMSQIPLMMYPILIGKYGIGPATEILGSSMGLIKNSGMTRKITPLGEDKSVQVGGMPSIDNYFELRGDGSFRIREEKLKGLSKDKIKEIRDLQTLVEKASAQGQLNRSLFYDTLGVEMSGRAKSKWDMTNAYSAFMFHQVERFNRQVAMTTVYKLELDRLRAKDPKKTTEAERGMSDAQMQEAASTEAIYRSQEMNGGAFLATAPRIAQTHIGRVASMYKTFGVQMYYTILKTGKIAFKDADPIVRRTAQKQLVGILGMSVLLSGVQGIPMFGAFLLVANMFLDDDEEDAETIVRQYIGEGWYKGAFNATLGVDVANRIGLGNLIFRLNPYAQNQSAADIAMQAVGGPAWSVGSQFARGVKDMMNGELQRGIENTLPAAFRNIAKTYRYSGLDAGGIHTRKGNPIYDDVTTGELLFQFFGFAPTGYTLQSDINRSKKEIERGTAKRRKRALDDFHMALAMGDGSDVESAFKDVISYNKKHPSWAIAGSTIQKSMAMRFKTAAKMHNGVTINPSLSADLLAHSNDFWGESGMNLAKFLDLDLDF